MEQPTDANNNTFANYLLYVFTALCYVIQHASAEQIYTWTFRVLSLISVILIIIINMPKAWQTIFKRKHDEK